MIESKTVQSDRQKPFPLPYDYHRLTDVRKGTQRARQHHVTYNAIKVAKTATDTNENRLLSYISVAAAAASAAAAATAAAGSGMKYDHLPKPVQRRSRKGKAPSAEPTDMNVMTC
jgi:hypothetical protein